MRKNKSFGKPFALLISPALANLPHINSNELADLQGDLKDLSESDYKRLRNSLKTYGFFIPLFVWFDPAGPEHVPYTLDGNQRLRCIRYEFPEGVDLPYIRIDAADQAEARTRILLISSQYGKVTKDGFDEFMANMSDSYDEAHDLVKAMTTFGEFLDRGTKEMVHLDAAGPDLNQLTDDDHDADTLSLDLIVHCENQEEYDELLTELRDRGFGVS